MKIRYVDHSIANRFKGYIEVNRNLKRYPELLKPILEHELAHTDENWSMKDFKLDFFSNSGIDHLKLFKFMIKYPRSFIQFLPIIYNKKKELIVDYNLLTMYLIMAFIFISTIYFGAKFL